jgi:hypothetical protein
MYSNIEKDGIEFIAKYKKLGYLIDVYSSEWMPKEIDKSDNYTLNIRNLEFLEKEKGSDFKGHLLALYMGDEDTELLRDLQNLYPPFRQLFEISHHLPDLLFINLMTKEILCSGLGRRNNSFSFELHKYLESKSSNLDGNHSLELDTDPSDDFFKLDHNDIVSSTLDCLEEFGTAYYQLLCLQGIEDMDPVRSKKDGLYYYDNSDEGLTKSEVTELKSEYKRLRRNIDTEFSCIRSYFPKSVYYELNTGNF